jgi:hypothetical protein
VGDLGEDEALRMLGVGVAQENPERIEQPIGRQHLTARAERHHSPG